MKNKLLIKRVKAILKHAEQAASAESKLASEVGVLFENDVFEMLAHIEVIIDDIRKDGASLQIDDFKTAIYLDRNVEQKTLNVIESSEQ